MNPNAAISKNLPSWAPIKEFEADAPLIDKISRVVNPIIFCVALLGACVYATGGSGLLLYASYLAMGLAARKIVSVFIGLQAYPATLQFPPQLNEKNLLKSEGKRQIEEIRKQGFLAEKISLYKSGVKYKAVRISHKDTITNGQWTIHALGNCMAMENFITSYAHENFAKNCNTLLINGPSVGSSGGWPTRYQMGAGFETGLRYLEEVVKATHIIMEGVSLGGGMMGEAILNHDFTEGMKNNIQYLSVSRVTFSRLSTIAAALVGRIVFPIFYITGTELDGIAAAKKLSQLGISQIIIQHTSEDGSGNDDVIPDNVSLAYELHQDPEMTNKIFLESKFIFHSGLPVDIAAELNEHIQQFLNKA